MNYSVKKIRQRSCFVPKIHGNSYRSCLPSMVKLQVFLNAVSFLISASRLQLKCAGRYSSSKHQTTRFAGNICLSGFSDQIFHLEVNFLRILNFEMTWPRNEKLINVSRISRRCVNRETSVISQRTWSETENSVDKKIRKKLYRDAFGPKKTRNRKIQPNVE